MSSTVQRDGELLVVQNGSTLPSRCVVCGDASTSKPRKFEFTWNPHRLGMGRSPVALVAVATNRRGKVFGHFCEQHRPRVARNVGIMLLIALVSGAVAAVGLTSQIMALFMVGALIAALTLGVMLFYIAKPPIWLDCEKIEGHKLWLKPLCAEYLNTFSDEAASRAK